ncbi:hypothetical protein AOC36_07930 [Erysipelothrix larvae]|uniref:Uncharacterized protein n=1 Tax=Erysipelothrix larvae TaxID=1514105 RepID=A0A120JTT6_9FIRM|nr:hypothetical protein AOC36_07930 [Erysipelothrix larvae]
MILKQWLNKSQKIKLELIGRIYQALLSEKIIDKTTDDKGKFICCHYEGTHTFKTRSNTTKKNKQRTKCLDCNKHVIFMNNLQYFIDQNRLKKSLFIPY